MPAIQAAVGRGGLNKPDDVRTVQQLLQVNWMRLVPLRPVVVSGQVDDLTLLAIEEFQRRVVHMLIPDGRVDPRGRTINALTQQEATAADERSGPNWPPRPGFNPLVSNEARAAIFGSFEYEADPLPNNPENIRVLGTWQQEHIITLRIGMGPTLGSRRIQFHRIAANQLRSLWADWESEGLLDRVLSFGGGYVPRFVRGSTTTLSNHSFGSAFDINMQWNRLRQQPALLGEQGCVRELVQLANDWGFYWGGHFNRRDGMHFEIARLV